MGLWKAGTGDGIESAAISQSTLTFSLSSSFPDQYLPPGQFPPPGAYPPPGAGLAPSQFPPAGGYSYGYAPADRLSALSGRLSGYPVWLRAVPWSEKTNGLAIASLICSLAAFACGFGAIAGVICVHFGRGQIRRTGREGSGLALAGLIIGDAVIVLGIAYIVIIAVVITKSCSSSAC